MSKEDLNVIFLGYAVNSQKKVYSGLSIAGNKMQINIIKNLARKVNVRVYVISISPIASFPVDKTLYFKRRIDNVYGVPINQISFINIPILKQSSQSKNVYKELKRIIKEVGEKHTIILSFNMFPPVGKPTMKATSKLGVKSVPIIADLPIDYSNHRGIISNLMYNRYFNQTKNIIKQLESVIVLNKYAAHKFAPQADFIVIDGGIDVDEDETSLEPPLFSYSEKNLLYCGALHKYSGVVSLANAFRYIKNDEVYLDIYGDGEDRDRILELSKLDNRIRYHGKVDNDLMIQKQKEAFLLVNPRTIDDPISKVTFPSKIFEYMMSGTPILSTKLNGFTSDYNDVLIFSDDDTEQGLGKAINSIIKMDDKDLKNYSEKAYEFVVSKKSWKKQSDIIISYLRRQIF